MKAGIKAFLAAAAVGIACAAFAGQPVAAAGKGNQRGSIGQMKLTPDTIARPVTADRPLGICVSGLSEGNVALVLVPYIGSPTSHSDLTYRKVVDGSGGFCFDAPPSWAQLDLQPGTYTVRMSWSNNDSSKSHEGPTAQFEVTAF